jgi:hypothetical protein
MMAGMGSLKPALRLAMVPVGAVVLWILLDLWLKVDLPGAPALEHLAFRALVGPLEWLTEGAGERMGVLLVIVGAVLVPALVFRWWRALDVFALGLIAMQTLVLVLALLMERALLPGVLIGVAIAWKGLPTGRFDRRAAVGFGLAAGGGSALYVYSIFMTWGQGYPLLQAAGRALRSGSVSFVSVYSALCLLVALAAAWTLRARVDLRRVGVGVLVGFLVASALRLAFGVGGPWLPGLFAVAAGVGIAAFGRGLVDVGGPELRWIPVRGALPTVLAMLVMAHTYGGRVLACPDEGASHLRLVGTTTEVFRMRHAGTFAALAMREDARFARLELDGSDRVSWVEPGPLRAPLPPHLPANGALWGTPEELIQADDGFWGTVVPGDPTRYLSEDAPWGAAVRNVVVKLDADARELVSVAAVPDLCWINTLGWGGSDGLLYAGCEDVPGLVRLKDGAVVDRRMEPRLGDVQDIAFGEDRIWTVSLWFRPTLTELRRSDLGIERQLPIGGSHYHLALDEARDRIWTTAWYGGRVRVVDVNAWKRIKTLPAGLGARPVEVLPDVVLVGSGYDGQMRLFDADSLELLDSMAVGGHVKDIAADADRGLAWFGSQCGLYELDWRAWANEARR